MSPERSVTYVSGTDNLKAGRRRWIWTSDPLGYELPDLQ